MEDTEINEGVTLVKVVANVGVVLILWPLLLALFVVSLLSTIFKSNDD